MKKEEEKEIFYRFMIHYFKFWRSTLQTYIYSMPSNTAARFCVF